MNVTAATNFRILVMAFTIGLTLLPATAQAWGGRGHRIVAAIAMQLIPDKAARIDAVLSQLEVDHNFVDAASYPDEYIRDHDPGRHFNAWHYANLRDSGQPFACGKCLFTALVENLGIIQAGKQDKAEAVAIAWVLHLVGDLHQPLHMVDRLRGGNDFHVTYRGKKSCRNLSGNYAKVELHSVWDDCLVEEFANGRDARTVAKALLGNITTYAGRPELEVNALQPWLTWGEASHALAISVAFDSLQDGEDLDDRYIKGKGKGLDVVQQQLLAAGIRLAYLLDQNFK
jgi:hypothetical protein